MQNALPILMYHHVSPSPGLVTVSPENFRDQIQTLANTGWKSIGTPEVEAFYAGQPLPEKSLLITFDDGYLDNLIYAYPVLVEFGMKAIIFGVTGWIKDGPIRLGTQETPNHRECKRHILEGNSDRVILRWSEIEMMQTAGTVEFHAHTHTHTRWDQQGLDTQACGEALAIDLTHCQATLRSRLGTPSRHLCWPQGYFHETYVSIAQDAGFDHLYTVKPWVNPVGGNKAKIGRFVARNTTSRPLTIRCQIYRRPWFAETYNWLKGI